MVLTTTGQPRWFGRFATLLDNCEAHKNTKATADFAFGQSKRATTTCSSGDWKGARGVKTALENWIWVGCCTTYSAKHLLRVTDICAQKSIINDCNFNIIIIAVVLLLLLRLLLFLHYVRECVCYLDLDWRQPHTSFTHIFLFILFLIIPLMEFGIVLLQHH